MKIPQIFFLLMLCGLVLMGCNSEKIKTYTCTGTITLDGDPVDQANIAFTNVKHSAPASARTDATGKFTLQSELGEFDVTIVKLTGNATAENPYAPSTNLLPEKYRSTKTSGFKAKVEANSSKNVFEFKLEK